MLLLAIVMLCIVGPLLWMLPVVVIKSVLHSPQIAERLGIAASPTAVRAICALVVLITLYVLSPRLFIWTIGLGTITLGIAIPGMLLFAAFAGLTGDEGFGAAFWRRAKVVPAMCGLFVVLLTAVMLVRMDKLSEVPTHARFHR